MNSYENYIGGAWVPSEEVSRNVNPSDLADVIGDYAQASERDVDRAVDAARAAFPSWSMTTPQQRFDLLDRVGSDLIGRGVELGRLLAREEGKTLNEALAEVRRAGQIFKFFAGEALRSNGEIAPSIREGISVEVTREPVGVFGIITPWNFPVAIPAWKMAPALAFGNCVIFKPAEQVPASAWELVSILAEAGVPDGVVNLLMGQGNIVGEAMVETPGIDGISFTGSVSTGARIGTRCVSRGKRVQLEMGGKNPMVVLDDADLDVAADACINGAFFSTGQRCTASSRIIVVENIHDLFVEQLVRRMKSLRVGSALNELTQVGPVVDARQLEQDERYLAIAKDEGAVVYGGERVHCETDGFFLAPALVTNTTSRMRINRKEVFGPIASVIKVKNYDEALAVANDTEFGLSAGICTASLKYAAHFKRHVKAGMVMVNTATAGVDYHVPFGGRKASSFGPREQGSYAREFYTTVKTAYVNCG
ncbi:aldehyde dehydrogenase family protein [Paraburkholderia sp. BL27I4N3]|uniref:aldehyde dehydrogenase family protein n=1 Tax=Paraburkholderia sp. BL27I4N3 TaxID=1938805 RepID=UPI001C6F0DD7|nr:aldehyde dehydrogenase family protein [Paraburkholderia sp. BL27I4N3]